MGAALWQLCGVAPVPNVKYKISTFLIKGLLIRLFLVSLFVFVFPSNLLISDIAALETEAVCLVDDASASLFMEVPNTTWLLAKAGLH